MDTLSADNLSPRCWSITVLANVLRNRTCIKSHNYVRDGCLQGLTAGGSVWRSYIYRSSGKVSHNDELARYNETHLLVVEDMRSTY